MINAETGLIDWKGRTLVGVAALADYVKAGTVLWIGSTPVRATRDAAPGDIWVCVTQLKASEVFRLRVLRFCDRYTESAWKFWLKLKIHLGLI